MGITFALAYGGSLATSILDSLTSSAEYDTTLRMCIITSREPALPIIATALPLAFEILAMGLTWWNAIDRPRVASTPLSRALAKDGFHFFLVCVLIFADCTW
jgi:hypothetical protein